MRKNEDREMIREMKLIESIDRHFGTREAFDVPEELEATGHMMDMFRVLQVSPFGLNLIHLFNDEIYDVVVEEKDLLEYISPGHIFLMAFVHCEDEWRLWHMSPPYSS